MDMDKAAVIREFLGWAETNKGVVLAWCDFDGAWEMSPQSADELVDLFVASQAHGAKLDAIVDNLLGGIPEMLASTYMPAEVFGGYPWPKERPKMDGCEQASGDWIQVMTEQEKASMRRLGAMSLVSPEWRPTPEAERGFAAMKEQAGDAALQAAKAGLLTVVQEQIHETLSRSAKTIDSVWHAALADGPKCWGKP